jgi:toxin FitB
MKRYLLDTNVISEVRKRKPHGAVLAWLEELRSEQILLSAVTMGELQAGIDLIRRHDSQKAKEIEIWVDQIESSYHVLPMDGACFRECSRFMGRQPNHLFEDAMIAATAQVHDLMVATRNEGNFQQFGVPIFNPFKPGHLTARRE